MGSITFEKFCRHLVRNDETGVVGTFVGQINDNRDLVRKWDYVFAFNMLSRGSIHEALKSLRSVPVEHFREEFRKALNVR